MGSFSDNFRWHSEVVEEEEVFGIFDERSVFEERQASLRLM
jgi:hypothetical protein